jgi:hypothetical protein
VIIYALTEVRSCSGVRQTADREPKTLFKSLTSYDLVRVGRHPRIARITVSNLLHEWVYHDRNHMQQIHQNVRTFLWPCIGGTQRFYEGSGG